MKSSKLNGLSSLPKENGYVVYIEQYNKLWDDVFGGTGTLSAVSLTLTGNLTVDGTTTLNGNLVLGDAAADSLTVNATTTYTDPINFSNETGITAGATQTQAGATALTEEINNVSTCTTAGDGVKLPAAVAGKHVYIKNSGATILAVYPATSDSIDALAVNLAIRIGVGSSMHFYAKDGTIWESANDNKLTLNAPTTASGQLTITAANSAGNTITDITIASQSAARTYTVPDAGATTASFVMTEGAQTINGAKTLGSVLLGPNGTSSLPTYSFTGDPNTGMFNSGADAIGFATGGTERWIMNGSGALNPLTNNVNDIGNGTVNVRDIYITRGIKGISANFGVRGIADATCTLETYTDGKDVVSIITLTNFIVGAIPGAGALAVGNKIFSFPAGYHVHSHIYSNVGFTIPNTGQTPVWGIGSVIGSTAVVVLNGTATFMDYITEQTAPDSAGTADPTLLPATAGLMTGISLNLVGSVKNVFLNAAETWAADNAGDLTASGTITIKWTIL